MSIDVRIDSTVLVFVSLSNCRLPLTPVSCRMSVKPSAGFSLTWDCMSETYGRGWGRELRWRLHLEGEYAYHLSCGFVEITVAV